jgi:DnaJ family protein A protein 2
MFGGGGREEERGPQKGKNVMFKLPVTLEDMYIGATKKIRFTRKRVCNTCDGKGGSKVSTCTSCRGRGVKVVVRQVGPGMIQQMQMQCDECDGKGESCDPRFICKTCRGGKVKDEKTTLEVHVNKGMKTGSKITFRDASDELPGVRAGDLVVVLNESKHDRFIRKGPHLYHKKKITLLQALTGFQFPLVHMDGRVLVVNSEPGVIVKPGNIVAIRDEGMPIEQNPYERGNLYINFEIEFPNRIDSEAMKNLVAVLGNKSKSADAPNGNEEPVELTEVDLDQEKKRWKQESRGNSSAYDEDEEEEAGAGGQQCRAQ